MCTSFKQASGDLCDAIASVARRMCSSFLDPKGLAALVACQLIALDKCPGVRPIGIGETVCRIIGKATALAIRDDIQVAAGPLQVCARHLTGCEAAVLAMRQVYDASDTNPILLVDASNAFNSLNHKQHFQTSTNSVQPSPKSSSTPIEKMSNFSIGGEVLLSQKAWV